MVFSRRNKLLLDTVQQINAIIVTLSDTTFLYFFISCSIGNCLLPSLVRLLSLFRLTVTASPPGSWSALFLCVCVPDSDSSNLHLQWQSWLSSMIFMWMLISLHWSSVRVWWMMLWPLSCSGKPWTHVLLKYLKVHYFCAWEKIIPVLICSAFALLALVHACFRQCWIGVLP